MSKPTWTPFQHPDNPPDTADAPGPDPAVSDRREPPPLTFHSPDSAQENRAQEDKAQENNRTPRARAPRRAD
jgi:hypothetical protein